MEKNFISKIIKREGSDNILGRGVINLLLFNAKILPPKVHKAIIGGLMRLLVHRKYKNVLRTNLEILYGDTLSDREREKKVDKILKLFKDMFIDMAYYSTRGKLPDYDDFLEEVIGKEYLEEAYSKGKGVIGLSAHLGGFLTITHSLSLIGFPNCATIMREADDKKEEEKFNTLRSRIGIKGIPQSEARSSGVELIKFLKQNGILIILADQKFDDGVRVKYMGRYKWAAKGPALLSMRLGSPVVPMYNIRCENGKYKLIIKPPIELVNTGNPEKDIQINTQRFTDELESMIRKYPDQWYAFNPWWQYTEEQLAEIEAEKAKESIETKYNSIISEEISEEDLEEGLEINPF
ncbi:MAG TPA: lysophospholipid acyltransferase family protein [Bacteroidales bacterium]|nr:lysophospholipid acyltransferase family protein [Bacteroidales bacterium]HOL74345.1 lysophospholipid acyltransferase family protein [Bacteroidales bacterium]